MRPKAAGIRAPEFPPMPWLNTSPLALADLSGRALLVDFWDYTCGNCLRAVPYLKSWHGRYAERGLVLVGVHTPEFPFGCELENVERAVTQLALPYPVAVDSDFLTWQAFHNRCWPANYLFDAAGVLRYYHFGEGDYVACERAIQECLSELDPEREWPPPLAPLRPEDRPGAVLLRATPSLYLGLERGRLGNAGRTATGEARVFTLPGRRRADRIYAAGSWRTELTHLESVEAAPAALHLRYSAIEVDLIMASARAEPIEVEIAVDGRPLPVAERGEDTTSTPSGATLACVGTPRLYRLVRHAEHGTHDLRLGVEAPGLRAYAFAFASCVAPA